MVIIIIISNLHRWELSHELAKGVHRANSIGQKEGPRDLERPYHGDSWIGLKG